MGAKPATTTTQGSTSGSTTNATQATGGSENTTNNTVNQNSTNNTSALITSLMNQLQQSQQQGTTAQTGTTQQTNQINPWSAALPGLQQAIQSVTQIGAGSDPWKAYVSPEQQQALQAQFALSQQPSAGATAAQPVMTTATGAGFGAGSNQLIANASGSNLTGNPYLDKTLNDLNRRTADAVNGQFSAAGRYGSAAQTKALADRIGANETNARMGQYNTERGYQNQAANALYNGGFQGAGLGSQIDASNAARVAQGLQAGGQLSAIGQQNQQAGVQGANWFANMMMNLGKSGQSGTTTGTTNQIGNISQAGQVQNTQNTSQQQLQQAVSQMLQNQQGTQQGTNWGNTNQQGTQQGTNNSTSQTVQPTNPWALGLGALTAGAGLLSGNPMALANIGSNLGGMFGGGQTVDPSMMKSGLNVPASGAGMW